jgi:hypothetical protein
VKLPKVPMIRKALMAAVTGAVAAAIPALPGGLTAGEIATIVGAAIIAGLAVYGIRNAPSTPAQPNADTPGLDRGAGELTLVLIAAAVCIVVIALAKIMNLI